MLSHLADLANLLWAMEPKALEALFAKLQTDPQPFLRNTNGTFGQAAPRKSDLEVSDGVATIRISGPLMRQVPWIFEFFGIEAASYESIVASLAEAAGRQDVKSIRLLISSPGGEVAGVLEAADAIRAAKAQKPVLAEVSDLCASAAYWLASQASEISAGPNDVIGSIGVYQAFLDSSKAAADAGLRVVVVASGPFKATGLRGTPITEDQLAPIKAVVAGIAENFVAEVARGRGREADQVRQWATGQVWIAGAAKDLGLIDRVDGISKTKGAAGGRLAADTVSEKERVMADEKAVEAAAAKRVEETQAAEKKRVQDLNAAFGQKDPAFALKAVAEGWSLEQAKGQYADILEKKLEASDKARQAAEAAAKEPKIVVAPGAAPVKSAGTPEPGEKDFMQLAKGRKAETGCSMAEAMAQIAAEQPEVHKAFIERTAEPARQRRKELGIGR